MMADQPAHHECNLYNQVCAVPPSTSWCSFEIHEWIILRRDPTLLCSKSRLESAYVTLLRKRQELSQRVTVAGMFKC